jgi:hypothetical protein
VRGASHSMAWHWRNLLWNDCDCDSVVVVVVVVVVDAMEGKLSS